MTPMRSITARRNWGTNKWGWTKISMRDFTCSTRRATSKNWWKTTHPASGQSAGVVCAPKRHVGRNLGPQDAVEASPQLASTKKAGPKLQGVDHALSLPPGPARRRLPRKIITQCLSFRRSLERTSKCITTTSRRASKLLGVTILLKVTMWTWAKESSAQWVSL